MSGLYIAIAFVFINLVWSFAYWLGYYVGHKHGLRDGVEQAEPLRWYAEFVVKGFDHIDGCDSGRCCYYCEAEWALERFNYGPYQNGQK